MALRITPMRPIERNGLKGFGLTVFIDNSPERATRRLDGVGPVQDGLKMSTNGRLLDEDREPCQSEFARRGNAPVNESVTAGETATHSYSSRSSSPETDKTGEVANSSPASPVHPSSGS